VYTFPFYFSKFVLICKPNKVLCNILNVLLLSLKNRFDQNIKHIIVIHNCLFLLVIRDVNKTFKNKDVVVSFVINIT